jgi:hypothetical protein
MRLPKLCCALACVTVACFTVGCQTTGRPLSPLAHLAHHRPVTQQKASPQAGVAADDVAEFVLAPTPDEMVMPVYTEMPQYAAAPEPTVVENVRTPGQTVAFYPPVYVEMPKYKQLTPTPAATTPVATAPTTTTSAATTPAAAAMAPMPNDPTVVTVQEEATPVPEKASRPRPLSAFSARVRDKLLNLGR